MKITETCIKRPVFSIVITLILVLLGIVSYQFLSVRQYPQVDRPVLTVKTTLDGASPDIIETQITKPMEATLGGLEGLKFMSSTSASEESRVKLVLREGRDVDAAANDVRDRLERVKDKLPLDARKPVIVKADADAEAIIYLAMTSTRMSLNDMQDYSDRYIKNDLEAVGGVSAVEIEGASPNALHVWLDPVKLAAYRVTVDQVQQAVKRQNAQISAGRVLGPDREVMVVTGATIRDVDRFNDIVIVHDKGYSVRVGDVGRVEFGKREDRAHAFFNGVPCVVLSIFKKSTANPLDISRELQDVLPKIKKSLPPGTKVEVAYDSTGFIEKSIEKVYSTLWEAVFFVVLIIWIFLWSVRATLIPLVTIPVSLIATFTLLYLFGFTINTLSLLALVLAIGLVVDDAIVMMENVYRHIEEGATPMMAAIKGSKEISFAIVAMTLTLAAVYAPIAMLPGQTGKLFTEFSLTLAGAVLISGIVSLTLSPMMCARLLRPHGAAPGPVGLWLQNVVGDKLFTRLSNGDWLSVVERGYRHALHLMLRFRSVGLIICGVTFLVGLILGVKVLKHEMVPSEDQGVVFIRADAPDGATVSFIDTYVKQMDDLVKKYPEVQDTLTFSELPYAYSYVVLKPWATRTLTARDLSDEMKPILQAQVTGLYPKPRPLPSQLSGSAKGGESAVFEVQTTKSLDELIDKSSELARKLKATGLFSDVQPDIQAESFQWVVKVDREKAAVLGVDLTSLGENVQALIKGHKAGDYKKGNEQYEILVHASEEHRTSHTDLNRVYVKGNKDAMIPLSTLVALERETVSPEITHFNQLRSITVFAYLDKKAALGEAVTRINDIADKTLGADFKMSFSASTLDYLESQVTMKYIFALAIAFIFLVMAAQFESFVDPFIILLSAPLAMSGALLTLWGASHWSRYGGSINIFSQIGLLTLIGLITKHGILIVDFANTLRRSGKSLFEAVEEASVKRLRPILMTTGAMVLGAVPLALATGPGAEGRAQIGWMIVGGMTLGTLFTIFILPVLYTYITHKTVQQLD